MKTTLLLFAVSLTVSASAQCLTQKVTLAERVQNSSLIAEGKVVSKKYFWNDNHTFIYTANTIELYKVFKGNPAADKITVITEGGVADGKAIIAHPSLKLSKGETGIFFVNADGAKVNSYKANSGVQGLIRYDFNQNRAFDAFDSYSGIASTLYQKIKSLTGKPVTVVKPFDVNEHLSGDADRAAPVITNFTPATVSAGTGTLLTINGSNFGSTQGNGYVSFRDADMGGSAYTGVMEPPYYQSWTDTQIKIFVPGDAMVNSVGTGNIQVTNNNNETGTSPSALTVDFNRYEVIWGGQIIPTILYDDNNSGGYTFRPHTEVAALPAATAALSRAMSTWNCADQVNWNISGTSTSTDVTAGDGINVVRYDNSSELPSGVLGYGSSYWSLYSNGISSYWVLTEADITIDDGTNWNYGPANPSAAQYDFESVFLHELGHIHQFNHVVNASSPMYYGIGNGQVKRFLAGGDMAGGINVCNGSVSACNDLGLPPMNLFFGPGCTTGGLQTAFERSSFEIYPNPAANQLAVVNGQLAIREIEIFDLLGQKIASKKFGSEIQNQKILLDVSAIREGIYVLKVYDSVSSRTVRFAVKR
jgi:hypothetical protein